MVRAARDLERKIARLTEAIEQARIAEDSIARLTPLLTAAVPDETPIIEASQRLTTYRDALREQQAASKLAKQTKDALATAEDTLATHTEEFGNVLATLAGGFEQYYREHGTVTDGTITTTEAAALSARYVSETLK